MRKMKRWRFWKCFQGKNKESQGQAEIRRVNRNFGFDAKVWSPLSQHRTSGHVHVVFLCTRQEFRNLLETGRPQCSEGQIRSLLRSLKQVRGF